MIRSRISQVVYLAAVSLMIVGGSVDTLAASADPLIRLNSEYQSGTISLDERAILTATAVRHPELLPAEYQVSISGHEEAALPSRYGTIALLEVYKDWSRLSLETQATLSQLLARPISALTYNTPGGFFKLHYDTIGTNAVPTTDGNGNGLPDFIEKCAAYCDSTLAKHTALGFLSPPSDGGVGGDSRYDIYFENQSNSYGYTQAEGPGPASWNDATSYLVLHNTFLGFPSNSDPEGNQYGAMKATIGHEIHHAVQFAYDYAEYVWFMEEDATYTEDVTFPLTHDNYHYLGQFFGVPATSLMAESYHMYGAFVWPTYLAQKFGQSVMRAVWEGAKRNQTVFTTLSDTLAGRYGWTQDSAMADFALWNFVTSTRNDGSHYADAIHYPLITIGATETSYPVVGQPPISPAGYAASYIQFLPGGKWGTLHVTFDGADTHQWAAWVDKSTSTSAHEFQQITLTPGSWAGQIDIPNFQNYASVTLIAVNVTEFGAAASFTYGAEIKSVFKVTSQIMTDSAVYSGASRAFTYRIYNNAPANDVIRISSTDTRGWINQAPFDKFILAGQSVDVTIPVQPQIGTPLGTSATLKFRATSRSDSTVVDSAQTQAVTVLQIGDVTFDGGVDIADLTGLIGYLYMSGPLPVPVWQAGNFDCQEGLDISDLTALIGYLFMSGPRCSCNPF
ncbi:MAG: hypothetical protein HY851_07665 [candidate division Zixibacteria bacterium]|nr:hypothetical protein [candidate division Zixibacteria bacterium]